MTPNWFTDLFLNGMQMLLTLRLNGTPPAESIEATAKVWAMAIYSRPVDWDKELDTPRINKAFGELAATSEYFPAPADFMKVLPARRSQLMLPKPQVNKMSDENRKRLSDLMKSLTIKKINTDF